MAAVPASHDTAPTWGHAGKDGAYPRGVSENQVLADQLANEATVEAIVRKRTLEGEYRFCAFSLLLCSPVWPMMQGVGGGSSKRRSGS